MRRFLILLATAALLAGCAPWLGLEKVYVQAKRWQSNVGRPELQAFYGALAGQKAKKGVFITTSGFTAQALDFAQPQQPAIVLGDMHRIIDAQCSVLVTVADLALIGATIANHGVHPLTGELWNSENGPNGGDEVNIVQAGGRSR